MFQRGWNHQPVLEHTQIYSRWRQCKNTRAASVKLTLSALVGMSLDSVSNMFTPCPKNKGGKQNWFLCKINDFMVMNTLSFWHLTNWKMHFFRRQRLTKLSSPWSPSSFAQMFHPELTSPTVTRKRCNWAKFPTSRLKGSPQIPSRSRYRPPSNAQKYGKFQWKFPCSRWWIVCCCSWLDVSDFGRRDLQTVAEVQRSKNKTDRRTRDI